MAGSINSQSNFGAFVPTTNVWDIGRIQEVDIKSPEFKELLVRLYQNVNNISLLLNIKDSGYYSLQEFINGQLFFPNPALDSTTPQSPSYRQVFRTVVNFGPLPNATTTSIPHNIQIDTVLPTNYSFTRIYGAATNPDQTSFLPLPYSSVTAGSNIEMSVTDTDVVITTDADYSAYTNVYCVLEYIKQ